MTDYRLDPWRIGINGTALLTGWFFTMNLPIPDAFVYETFAQQVPQSQGATSLQGYIHFNCVWNLLTPLQGYVLQSMIATVRAAGTRLYMTVPRQDAESCRPLDWTDIAGYVNMPAFTTPPNSYGRVYSPVELRLNNVSVITHPASGV